jgi:hypothetical protein
MLDRLTPLAHLLRMLIEAALHCFKKGLMLPTGDPPLFARGAFTFYRAALTDVGPVAAQDQSIFLGRVAVGELLTGRTEISVLLGCVAEVLLSKPALGHHA